MSAPPESKGKTGFEGGNAIWTMTSVPAVIEECCSYLEKHGFDDEGIFRVTGSFRDINLLKAEYSNGNSGLDLTEVSPHSVAGVLTHFFNESEEPIIPFELYDFCVECMELEPASTRLEGIKTMLYALPPGNFLILKRFMKILKLCSNESEINKMGASNLAIAMSPTLIRPLEATIETLISHGDTLSQLVAIIIENYDSLFETAGPADLPDNIADAFFEVLQKSSEDIDKRLPENFMSEYGPLSMQRKAAEVPAGQLPISKLQAIWRGRRLRRKLQGVKFAYQTAYNQACWDYMRRENNFVHAMKRAIKDFETLLGDNYEGKRIRKLQALHTTQNVSWQAKNAEAEVKSIVSGFKAIIEIHQMLYEDILNTWESSWPLVKGMGAALIGKFPLFIVYNMYIDMYCRVDGLMHADDANIELEKWMKATAGSSQYRRTLGEVLRLPFEHVIGCAVPIQRFLNCVLTYKEDISDTNNIVKSFALLQRIRTSLGSIDRRISFQRAQTLESSILGLRPEQKFASIQRRLLKHGQISINKQWMYVFLFEDICVVCQQNKDSFVFEHTIKMKGTTVTDTSRLGFLLHSTLNDYNMLNKRAEEKVSFFVAFQQISEHWNSDRFGVPLKDLLEREKNPENMIPNVVEKLATYLRQVSEERNSSDFFCLGCDTYSVTALRNRLNSVSSLDEVDLNKFPLPVVVEVLRLFLMELPSPLLDRAVFKEVFTDRSETSLDMVKFYQLVQQLEEEERKLLFYVCDLLSDTMLHPSILAQTWGMTLFRSYTSTISEALSITGVTTIVRDLLMYYSDLCSPDTGEDYFREESEMKEDPEAVYAQEEELNENLQNLDPNGALEFEECSEESELLSPTASDISDIHGVDDSMVEIQPNTFDFESPRDLIQPPPGPPIGVPIPASLIDTAGVQKAVLPPPIGAAAAVLPPPPAALPSKPDNEPVQSTIPNLPPKPTTESPDEPPEGPPSAPPPAAPIIPVRDDPPPKSKTKRRISMKNIKLFRSSGGTEQQEY